jgi:hypothetical protein
VNNVDEILQKASGLPLEQQLNLANRLLEAVEQTANEESDQTWDTIIRERISRYDQGLSKTRPMADVLADLDQKLNE